MRFYEIWGNWDVGGSSKLGFRLEDLATAHVILVKSQ